MRHIARLRGPHPYYGPECVGSNQSSGVMYQEMPCVKACFRISFEGDDSV